MQESMLQKDTAYASKDIILLIIIINNILLHTFGYRFK